VQDAKDQLGAILAKREELGEVWCVALDTPIVLGDGKGVGIRRINASQEKREDTKRGGHKSMTHTHTQRRMTLTEARYDCDQQDTINK
jgi:hypothetical protein